MSQWTHVNACIRFDDIRIDGLSRGKPDKGAGMIPEGSEGPLQYQLIENPCLHSMAAYVVLIWGDLRDYEDVQEILDYLAAIVDGKAIRSGIAEIDVEYKPTLLFRYDNNNDGGAWTSYVTK